MDDNFLVSVIVPVFNAEKYLKECIESILSQSYAFFELVLVDDGSTDGSRIICEQYAKDDRRIKFIHQENAGVSSARNVGIENSQGSYITFVDSDDWLDTDFLKVAASICKKKNCDIFMSGIARVSEGSRLRYGQIGKEIYSRDYLTELEYVSLLDNCYTSSCCASLYRRSFIGSVRFDTSSVWGEDLSFVHKMLRKRPILYATPQIFYNYRLAEGSATMRFEASKGLSVQNTYLVLYGFADSMGYLRQGEYVQYIDKRMVSDYLMLYDIIWTMRRNTFEQFSCFRSLLSNKQIRNRLKQQEFEPYFRRYGNSAVLVVLYRFLNRKRR